MKSFLLIILSALIFTTSCASKNKKTMAGTGIGAAVGAGLGGIIGKEKGAIIGGVLGAGIGGYAGHRLDKQAQELEKIAETKRTDMGLVTKLKSDILFPTGKATLKPAAKQNLKEMAQIIQRYPEDILTVKGYTDDTGSSRINEKLSAQRAEAVKQELLVAGLSAQAVSSIGMGPASPVASNDTASGRSQNRRVEIEVTVDESKVPKKK